MRNRWSKGIAHEVAMITEMVMPGCLDPTISRLPKLQIMAGVYRPGYCGKCRSANGGPMNRPVVPQVPPSTVSRRFTRFTNTDIRCSEEMGGKGFHTCNRDSYTDTLAVATDIVCLHDHCPVSSRQNRFGRGTP